MSISGRLVVVCLLAASACGKPRPSAQKVETTQAACGYTKGMLTEDTTPGTDPVGTDIPVNHFVLLMQENRSFDHYYSTLTIPGQTIDVASPTATNPDAMGNLVQRYHFTSKCMPGGDHSWDAEHANLDGGKNDGFVKTNNSTVPMGYYTEDDLPYYYALARNFAISDRHFCSALAPTWPNRMFWFAATSFGITNNVLAPVDDAKGNPEPNLFSELDDVKVDWQVYAQDYPTPVIVAVSQYVNEMERFKKTSQFASDVAAGNLAPITVVEFSDVQGVNSPDEGPPGDVDIGQQAMSGVIDAVMKSKFWKDTVIFLTYDENGGMWDHVVPPKACVPDDSLVSNGETGSFNQYGFRVPLFVISPYAKRGYVSHVVTDHTSVLRFIEARFELPSMSKRDANATPVYDMFDFQHPNFAIPNLPTVTVDQAALTACM